jgi:hypothetical protein
MTKNEMLSVRLVFADRGTFHTETIRVSRAQLDGYDRLVDLLREDPEVTRLAYVDMKRLVSATVVEGAV